MDPVWEKLHSSRQWGKYPAEDLIRTLMRAFRDPELRKKTNVLEIGCGAGANLVFLLQEGFQVYAMDGAPSAVANAKKHAAKYVQPGQTCELSVGDFKKLDFPDASFDVVVDYLAIYANTMDTVKSAIAEAKRVLKPGGHFYSRVFGSNTFGAGGAAVFADGTSKNPTEGPLKDLGTSHFFDEKELRALYAGWPQLTLRRSLQETIGDKSATMEEWVAWATK